MLDGARFALGAAAALAWPRYGKARQDADFRKVFDESLCAKIPRLRATGVVKLDAPHAIIQFGDRRSSSG
jgi:hypothetical protein